MNHPDSSFRNDSSFRMDILQRMRNDESCDESRIGFLLIVAWFC
jgi:hypothetical protein